MLEHGGRLQAAATEYAIPLEQWLDLSTGINPLSWPVPMVPEQCWQRLPENEDGLLEAAQTFYGQQNLLLMSGSQAAIQGLPKLRGPSRVGVINPSYAEHAYQWQVEGHTVAFHELHEIPEVLDELDVLIIINPNNPTGDLLKQSQLLTWHAQLEQRGGWLIVDEAFMDSTQQHSLLNEKPRPGLIVLRSLGKFFGLAGLRVGAVFAEKNILNDLDEMQGPWPLSTASRWLAKQALLDTAWQQQTCKMLEESGQRLKLLLQQAGFDTVQGCGLFQWLLCDDAQQIQQWFASRGVLLRLYQQSASLRFGLPGLEAEWQRLGNLLSELKVVRETGKILEVVK